MVFQSPGVVKVGTPTGTDCKARLIKETGRMGLSKEKKYPGGCVHPSPHDWKVFIEWYIKMQRTNHLEKCERCGFFKKWVPKKNG